MCRRASFSGEVDGRLSWFGWSGVDWVSLMVSVRLTRGSAVMLAVDSSHCLFGLGRVYDQLVGLMQSCCNVIVD